ncbi:MAG: serine/threonine protein kinase [Deltaproteobacteria bacterium]|jgi:eukaryotic-like serine/threonine-protein kinase|nr:serine/threonine protein kinase [Deltaproteobacteria bacterium]MBT4091307.1 serine/threonine protein kinase [Deltaproteobacteria bacterium]MBT4641280.1 serine/threonine protein kinase [Deltaproteobacteria bacterium]MBT6504250.1 serine/threonine protein kinase [Deltaproteobacteria bacterium]MBT6610986.1 serine/threonine protein kinase [Deltaproteobacteria bacterium]
MSKQPSKIGKYKILSQIGEGGMGAVFKAEHPTLNRIVIIKKLTTASSQDFIERFRREAKIMMDFRNEHIVQVYDHFKEGDSYFIVMEFVDGITLENLIQKKRYFSNQAAILIFTEICSALKYAHDQMVIHRDIKPANILISKEGVVKLVDFGVSTSLDNNSEEGLTKVGMTIGTPSYLAPEQIANAKNRDKRTDIYSMGVMFYEMVVGKKPFQGGFTPEIIASIEKGKYTLPRKINPKISPQIQKVIRKAMHHKVNKRFQDLGLIPAKLTKTLKKFPIQEDINAAIKRYLEGKDELEAAPSKLPKLSIPGRLFGIAITIVLISAFAGGTAFWAWQQGYHYEYLFSDDYGALQINIKIRKSRKELHDLFLKPILFSENRGKLKQQNEIVFKFKQDNKGKSEFYGRLMSDKVYLKAGSYLALFYVENLQYRQNFYLAPRSFQKQQHDTRDARQIAFTIDTPPQLPVKLIYKITDSKTGRALPQQNEAIAIYRNNSWINWQAYIQNRDQLKQFKSGNRYQFRFKHKGYYTSFSNVTIQPEQSILKLNINLTPLPGELFLKSDPVDLEIQVNSSTAYISGGKTAQYKQLPSLAKSYQKLRLAPGEYFLTARNRRLVFNATSSTKKLTVKSGEKTYADLSVNSLDQSVIISIK